MVTGRNIKNIGKPVFIPLVLFVCLLLASPVSSTTEDGTANCLKLGADDGVAEFHPMFEGVVASIYKRIGHCVISISIAPKRSEMMLAIASLDGDWMRADGFKERSGLDIIEVPVPLFELDMVFLTKANSSFNGTPEDMNGRTVGYPAGFAWIEDNLLAVGAIPKEVPTGVPVRELLLRDRFEVFATDGVRAFQMMGPQDNRSNAIRQTSWTKVPFFHLVHAKHKNKVGALAQEIKKAISTGEFDHMFDLPGLSRATPAPTKP